MVVITEIDCESNVYCGGGDLSIIVAGNCNDYSYNEIVGERSTVDLLEWLKINGFSLKSVNNEQVFVNVNESKSENKDSDFGEIEIFVELDVKIENLNDTINDPIINENTFKNTESVNIHVDEQTQTEVKKDHVEDYPTVIFPDTFVTPEIDIQFGSLGPFKEIHIEIEPKCGAYNNNFDMSVNDIKSVSSPETEAEAETQKSVLSVEEKHSDDQTEKEAVENNQIMETEEPTEITENKEIEKTDEKTTEIIIENKESGKTEELRKEETEVELEENMKAKKAMRKKRKAEEARMRAEKRAQKEAEEQAHKELKEAEEKEKARLKRLKKKGKKRTGGGNIKGGDVAESNKSKEFEYTNEEQHQCSPPPPRAPAATMAVRNRGRWRPMVVAATLIPAMFVLHIISFF